ncbi:MAG TPA: DUF3306 domain-containing protein, partial [Rhodobacteraceae bacterium]|nr:DUF3306 domain-containing protein [Paracoccaceae bacterium]
MSAPLDRWSRRRAAVQAEAEAEARTRQQAEAAAQQAAMAEKTDTEILAELGLPDPETMQPGDDFSGFMQVIVPERIRKLALRKLWRSNPVLANVDHLVDYGEDFTKEGTLGVAVKTAYQVGKGMLKHVDETEASGEETEKAAEEPDVLTEETSGEGPMVTPVTETLVETPTEQPEEPDF